MRAEPGSISLAQHCGPHHGARGRVQRHHSGGHQTGVPLPQTKPGVQSAAALQEQLRFYTFLV